MKKRHSREQYRDGGRDQSGFTFVELLVYMTLLLVFLSVSLPVLNHFLGSIHDPAYTRLQKEAQVFIQQFEHDARRGDSFHITEGGDVLEIDIGESVYRYEQRGDALRRARDARGHLVFAQFVDDVSFKTKQPPVLFEVSLTLKKDGATYELQRLVSLRGANQTDIEEVDDGEEEKESID